MKLIKESKQMMKNFFDDLHSYLLNRDYLNFTEESGKVLAEKFMKKYEGIFTEDTRFFKFSVD